MRMKRIAAFLLVALALQCMMTTSAFASDKAAQPRFSDFSSIYAGLYDVGNGIYVIEGTAAAPNASKRVYITLTLEKIEGNKKHRSARLYMDGLGHGYSTDKCAAFVVPGSIPSSYLCRSIPWRYTARNC